MKFRLLTIAFFTIIASVCFAQNVSGQYSEQTTDKKLVNRGKTVIPSGKIILAEMKTIDPRLYSQYQTGKKMQITGIILTGVGGGVVMTGAIFSILPDADKGEISFGDSIIFETDGNNEGLRKAGPVLMAAGAVCLSAGIPVMIIGVKKKKQARRDFVDQYYLSQPPSSFFQMNIYPNSVGIAYVF